MATDCQAPVHVTEDKQIQTQLAVVNCPEELEENNLRDLSVILRSNVFPGSSYESEEWCSVVKSVYQDHEVSPDREVGIFMRPKKDYRRKVWEFKFRLLLFRSALFMLLRSLKPSGSPVFSMDGKRYRNEKPGPPMECPFSRKQEELS